MGSGIRQPVQMYVTRNTTICRVRIAALATAAIRISRSAAACEIFRDINKGFSAEQLSLSSNQAFRCSYAVGTKTCHAYM